jgi:hypothetical protein
MIGDGAWPRFGPEDGSVLFAQVRFCARRVDACGT